MSDPNDSLRTGDVIRFAGGWPTSRHIKHVVVEILAPWGPPVEERPRIPSEAERIQKRLEKRERKLDRRRRRREGESESEMEIEENGEARQESESKPKSNETQELNTS